MARTASPTQAARAIRTIATVHQMGPTPTDEDEILAEIELRGIIMHGMPPRDEAEWDFARRVFDADAIKEFERWDRRLTERYAQNPGMERPVVGWDPG